MSHYDYLEKHFVSFAKAVGATGCVNNGIISAHGDKFYGYKDGFKEAGIPFEKGVAIGLLTYLNPFANECRDTPKGWVAPVDWIISNKERFLHLLP